MHLPSPQEINIKLFISYADLEIDEKLVEEFEKHLSVWKQKKLIDVWNKRKIGAGREWLKETEEQLSEADIILLMISPDFIASDNTYNNELKQAIERYELEKVNVIPIILRPVLWEDTPFSKFKCLPRNGKAVKSRDWENTDEAFYAIANDLRDIIKDEIKKKKHYEYERILREVVEQEYPINSDTLSSLNQLSQQFQFSPGEAKSIERLVYDKKQQEYQLNLERYRQEYQHLRRRYFFLSVSQREKLLQLKITLKLQNADVAKIESKYTVINAARDYFYDFLYKFKFRIYLVGIVLILAFCIPVIKSVLLPQTNQPPNETEYREQSLSQKDATNLVERWLVAKPEIFGKKRNLEIAKDITAGEKFDSIKNSLNGMSTGSYILYEEPHIEVIGFCSVGGNKAEIHLKVKQAYTEYENNVVQPERADQEYDGAFGLQYINKNLKLVDEGIASNEKSLSDFRNRFWGQPKAPCQKDN